MSSRQEEKERRKQERLERERAEAAAAQRKRLVQIVGGVIVAATVVVVVVIVTSSGGGKGHDLPKSKPPANALPIPARKITDLEAAAKAASCTLTNPPIEGRTHTQDAVTYKTNPPTSGNHNPEPAQDGDYAGVVSPGKEHYVHSLEHGRIIMQYKPGLALRRVRQLETLYGENSKTDFGLDSIGGGYTLLMQNNTGMPYDVAAVAWGHQPGASPSA